MSLVSPYHPAKLVQQGCSPTGVMLCGPQHALGVLGNFAGEASMPSRANCTAYSKLDQVPSGHPHVEASKLREATCR